ERISRSAGVVGGADWDVRLRRYADDRRRVAERLRASDDPVDGAVAQHERDADAAAALRTFATDLAGRLAECATATTWSVLAAWSQRLVRSLFGDESALARLPEAEARAAGHVDRILAGLAGLDPIEPAADLTLFRQVVELELADSLPRVGRYGEGVLVAPLSSAVGLDADVVTVLGLAEDLYPGRHPEGSLLPDRVREAAGGELPASRDPLDRRLRHLLAAFAAAPTVVASFPRGDLRRHCNRLPSRWLLPTLRARSGHHTLAATEWERLEPGRWLQGSPSYAGMLATTSRPASEQEWRLRTLTANRSVDDDVLDRVTRMLRARASDAFTRYDGNLAGLDLPDVAGGDIRVSPTQLEAWATCPHAYFIERMLRVEPVEEPEALLAISPLEIGNLVHEMFDAFVKAAGDSLPGPGEPWSAEHSALLREIARDRAAALERRGVTGHPRLWEQERARIFADLGWLLDADQEWRALRRARLVDSELRFGLDGQPPVTVALPDGREIRFRGSADRVDVTSDGTLVVTDLKTGSARRFNGLGEADPVLGGRKLQLPVYAYAARSRYGSPEAPVEAAYWFIRRDRGRRIELPLTPAVERRYVETLATIAAGIAAGVFPQRPPDKPSWAYIECPYCDPDGLGHREARRRWERKREHSALAAYRELAEPSATDTVSAHQRSGTDTVPSPQRSRTDTAPLPPRGGEGQGEGDYPRL
ncbi:MAG: PD-(D/E)XK nuclease family protein, partial [Longimicrobiales bacterium]